MDEAEIKEVLELLDQETQAGVVGRAARAMRRSLSVSVSVPQSRQATANSTPTRLATNNGSVPTTPSPSRSRQGKAKVGNDKGTQTADVQVKSSEEPAIDHQDKFPGIKPEVGYKFRLMGMTLMVVEAPESVGGVGGGRGGELTNGEPHRKSVTPGKRGQPPPSPLQKANKTTKKRKEEESPSSSKADKAKGSGGGARAASAIIKN